MNLVICILILIYLSISAYPYLGYTCYVLGIWFSYIGTEKYEVLHFNAIWSYYLLVKMLLLSYVLYWKLKRN